MIAYTLRRLFLIIPTLLGVMLLNYVIIQAAPGGPVDLHNPGNWWRVIAGADWRHPAGPGQLDFLGLAGRRPAAAALLTGSVVVETIFAPGPRQSVEEVAITRGHVVAAIYDSGKLFDIAGLDEDSHKNADVLLEPELAGLRCFCFVAHASPLSTFLIISMHARSIDTAFF